jgi:hypothetical protein
VGIFSSVIDELGSDSYFYYLYEITASIIGLNLTVLLPIILLESIVCYVSFTLPRSTVDYASIEDFVALSSDLDFSRVFSKEDYSSSTYLIINDKFSGGGSSDFY